MVTLLLETLGLTYGGFDALISASVLEDALLNADESVNEEATKRLQLLVQALLLIASEASTAPRAPAEAHSWPFL